MNEEIKKLIEEQRIGIELTVAQYDIQTPPAVKKELADGNKKLFAVTGIPFTTSHLEAYAYGILMASSLHMQEGAQYKTACAMLQASLFSTVKQNRAKLADIKI